MYPWLGLCRQAILHPLAVVVKHTANFAGAVVEATAFDGSDLGFQPQAPAGRIAFPPPSAPVHAAPSG